MAQLVCGMNVLVLLTCLVFFVLHEIVAHIDVCLALPDRVISAWEQPVHAYLSTIPFYLMSLIICRNWNVFMDVLTMPWGGKWSMSGAHKLSVAWATSGGIRRLCWCLPGSPTLRNWFGVGAQRVCAKPMRDFVGCGRIGRDRFVLLAFLGTGDDHPGLKRLPNLPPVRAPWPPCQW